MAKILGLLILIGCAMATAVVADSGHLAASDPFQSLDELTASGKHKSWCSFKAASARIWCQMKAQATFDSVKRQIGLDNCAYAYNVALQACPNRRLTAVKHNGEDADPCAAQVIALLEKCEGSDKSSEEQEKCLIDINNLLDNCRALGQETQTEKHQLAGLNTCVLSATVVQKLCQRTASQVTDPVLKAKATKECASAYAQSLDKCSRRRLDKALALTTAQKHKSWCTFKAATARTWCQVKAQATFDSVKRRIGLDNCAYNYQVAVQACPKRRLSGQKHKLNWCKVAAGAAQSVCLVKAQNADGDDAKQAAKDACLANYKTMVAKCPNRRLSTQKHKLNLCSIKIAAYRAVCLSNANKMEDIAKRKKELYDCDVQHEKNKANCNKRRLSNNLPTTVGQKHKSWCSFKAAVANKWCQTKAIAHLDANVRKNALAACSLQYNTALSFCPKRRLENLLRTTAQKHKSWCTFKASVARAWCKTKGTRWDNSSRNSNYINCDNAYNLQVAQCAQRRLMRDFEKAIKSGNAHEGWCEFKNRSRWLWCKATKSVNLNAEQRRANLAQCDANYNAGDAACRNANLAINVSANASASN